MEREGKDGEAGGVEASGAGMKVSQQRLVGRGRRRVQASMARGTQDCICA